MEAPFKKKINVFLGFVKFSLIEHNNIIKFFINFDIKIKSKFCECNMLQQS